MPGLTPSREALGAGGITATPRTGSIPRIRDDETFSPTTTGSHRVVRVPTRDTKKRPTRPRKRRSLTRRGWIPDQHGAWPMLLVPFWLGVAWSSFSVTTLVVFATWLVGYFCFHATTLWLRSGRKERLWPPVRAYGLATLALGLLVVVIEPTLLEWCVFFLPLVGCALWLAWHKRDRSLLARSSAVAASTLMCLVAYDVGTGFTRSQLAASWLQHSQVGTLSPALPAHADLGPWAWIVCVAACIGAYFWCTIPYVKTLVRERGSRPWLLLSVGAHAACTLVATIAAVQGWAWWPLALVWLALTIRAAAGPLWSARSGKRVPVRIIGWGEMAATLVLVLLLLNG